MALNEGWRGSLLGVAIVLSAGGAGGMIASAALASRAYQAKFDHAKRTDQTLVVTGSARKRIRSDLAIWNIRVSGSGADLKAAFQVLKDGYDAIAKFLEKSGFAANEIATSAIDTEITYARDRKGNPTNEISAYTLRRSFTITTGRVDAVARPAAEVTELIQNGISVVSAAPEYHYTKLGELKIEMIGEASKDARARPEQIVANAGCVISEVRTARVGVLQITQPESTDVSDSGINDTSTINKDVRSVVSLTLGLETR